MDESLFNTFFFFGTKELNISESELRNQIPLNPSAFAIALSKILNKLGKFMGSAVLAKKINLPIEILKENQCKGGICVLCGQYFMRLNEHLEMYHAFKRDNLEMYSELFAMSTNFYMSEELKRIYNGKEEENKENSTKKAKIWAKNNVFVSEINENTGKDEKEGEANWEMCEECGEKYNSKMRNDHLAMHTHTVKVKCLECGIKVTKKHYFEHIKYFCKGKQAFSYLETFTIPY